MAEDHPGSAGRVVERLDQVRRHKGGRQRHVGGCQLLGTRDQIWRLGNGRVLATPEVARPAQAGDDLVPHQKHVVPVAHRAHRCMVPEGGGGARLTGEFDTVLRRGWG